MQTKKITYSLLALLIVTSFILPGSVSAKNDKKENRGNGNTSISASHTCFRAFGHFIAPGWLKKNDRPLINENCFFPFGIWKKLSGRVGTTTPPVVDTSAPIITNIVVDPSMNSANISWSTNEKSNTKVYWSTTTPLNLNGSATASSSLSAKVLNHSVTITGLTASTTYHAVVSSKDAAGNVATSSEFTFTTEPILVFPDTTAPIISSVVAVVGTSTINVAWMTNENATSKIYYGTSTPLATSTANFVANTSLTTSHLLHVSGLATSTNYKLLIESKDGANNIGVTTEFSATTGF